MVITSTKSVSQGIEKVWKLITYPPYFYSLRIPGTHRPFKTTPVKRGTEFLANSGYTCYVTDWIPHRVFSFSDTAEKWMFRFELIDHGMATDVQFSRDFPWWAVVNYPSVKHLTYDTVNALSDACENLSSGRHHGLTSACTEDENTGEPKF